MLWRAHVSPIHRVLEKGAQALELTLPVHPPY